MKKIILLLVMSIVFTNLCEAQLSSNQFEGYVIDSKGKKYEGVIEIEDVAGSPWENQDKVTFIEKSVAEAAKGKKIDKKDKKKFDASDVKEYQIGTRKFITVKYTNIQGALKSSGGNRFTALAGAAKSLSNNEFLAEVIMEGEKISLYRFYNSPPPVSVSSGAEQAAEVERVKNDCINNYDILYTKKGGKEKAKAIARPGELAEGKQSFRDLIEDCKVIEKKFDDGAYVMKPLKKGIKAMIKEAMTGKSFEEKLVEVVTDYNKECGK